ncbi:ATP-dependent metallopeptidase FtsH/Yme1/Tma family protein [Campylobacter geochelonis]|uniref:Putative cell division protease FtsH-like protein n=1 Tax=Campylobacter geochelonis TaxID=1780362 RepID=A0A128EJU8_9BACT|nr:ATP-dependent metallopeptidase FtsH/Yme1/Tma family protein [Campylobacter geochelonis]CZE48831.1 putative cell division protease FtsH-like protein [Campylobacter geochelonis]CZE51539.1 putative cell division protease FtsH-like protein [Campylobacter geochelonis]
MMLNLQEILQKFKLNKLNIALIFLVILIGLLAFVYLRNSAVYINYNEYKQLLDTDSIQKARIENDKIYLTYNGKEYVVLKEAVDLKELYEKTKITKSDETPYYTKFIIMAFIVLALIFAIEFFIIRNLANKKKTQSIETSKSAPNLANQPIKPVLSNVKFSDVAGIEEIKSELVQIVDFLKNPEKYKSFGINLPKGVLMAGAPGVGKTLIAKAVAGEAGVPFYYQSGASFSEIYVGVGAKKVRELFANAKSNAPSIIFIDEIDSVGKSRGDGRNDEREATLNQLLTEMDGFEENSGVIVIAATNKIEMIDDALLRPGRFDRRVFISLPNYKDRIEIIKIYLKNKNHDVDISKLSRLSVGFSGAGLATFVNEATINAISRGSKVVQTIDFESVKNKVLFGKRKTLVLDEDEKEIQALYQGAKALSAYWFEVGFDKINLLEDGFINDDREIESKTVLKNKLKVYLSGLAALKIYKDDMFNNAKFDIQKSLNLANSMIYEYGMGESFMPKNDDVLRLLDENYAEVSEFLKSMQNSLFAVAKHIFVYESVHFEMVRQIIQEQYTKDENED